MDNAFYWMAAYRKSTLVPEVDLLALAATMPTKTTIKARLLKIDYSDMVAAVNKLGHPREYSYSGHGDIFEISRHGATLPVKPGDWK